MKNHIPYTGGMILKIPQEPIEIKKWMQSLRQNQLNTTGVNWDAYVVWAGNKLPKYLWDNWKDDLKPLGLTWQKFMRLLRHRTDVGVMWYQGTLPWPDFIRKVSDLVKGPIGQDIEKLKQENVMQAPPQDLGALQLPAISDWEKFERFCRDLWAELWENKEIQLNGRTGQRQAGVDVYGCIGSHNGDLGGIQCKRKDNFVDDSLTVKELRKIVNAAKKFNPKLKRFIVAYTGKREVKLQNEAVKISEKHKESGLFSVAVFSWDDIKLVLGNYPEVIDKYFSDRTSVSAKAIESLKKSVDENLKEQTQNKDKIIENIQLTSQSMKDGIASMAETVRTSIDTTVVTKEYDAELDEIRDLIDSGKAKEGLDRILKLEKRLNEKVDALVKFRVATNKAAAFAGIGDTEEAGRFFIEAYQYNKDSEKAQSNRALGFLLIDQKDEAKKYAEEILKINPLNEKAHEILIYCAKSEDSMEKILSRIPKILLNKEGVASVLAETAKDKGDIKLATEFLESALKNLPEGKKSPNLSANLASTILQTLTNKFDLLSGIQITTANRALIERAIDLLSESILSLEGSQTLKYKVGWLINRSTAYKLVGELEKSLSDIERAQQLQPDDFSLPKQKAFILHAFGKVPEAIKILRSVQNKPDVPEAALLLAGMLFESGDPDGGIPILEAAIKSKVGSKDLQEEQKRLLANIYLKKQDYSSAKKIAEELRSSDPTDITNLIELARVEKIVGNQSVYSSLIDEARGYVAHETSLKSLFFLAEELYSSKRYADAWPIYERLVDTSSGSALVNKLIYSYYQSEKYEKALEVIHSIPISLKDNFIYEIEISILDSMGDLDGAIEVSEKYLAKNPSDLSFRIKLATAFFRKGETDRLDEFLNSDLDYNALKGDIALEAGKQLAWLYAERNMSGKSLEVAYWFRKKFGKNVDAHLAYIGIFFNREKEMDTQLDVNVVGLDVAVKIEQAGSQPRWHVIDNADYQETITDLKSNDRLAKMLAGKKVGDEIILEEGKPSETRLKVVELKHKYVYALHETMEIFPYLFEENPAMKRFSVKTGSPEETKKSMQDMLDIISSRDEWILKVQKFYEDGQITIGTFANMIGKNVIVVWGGLISNTRIGIRCCLGNMAEREAAFNLIKGANEIVIDITALLTCGSIKQLNLLKKMFSDIYIAQSTIDTLSEEISDKGGMGSKGFTTVWKENGQFYRKEVTQEDIKKTVDFLEEIRSWVKVNCKVVPVKEAIKLPKARRKQLEKTIGKSFLDTILIAKEKKCAIYSDDLANRMIAKSDFGIDGFWTQAVAIMAREKAIITPKELEEVNIGLITRNYNHTTIESTTLLEAARQANWLNVEPFSSVLYTLSRPTVELKSAAMVAIDFCYSLWKEPLIDFQREGLVFAILDAVSAQRDKIAVFRIFSVMVPIRFRIIPLAGGHLLKLITAWRSIRN